MKKIAKAFEWLIFCVLIGILLAAASPFLPTKQFLSTYVVTSGSMEPAIPTGGVVFTIGVDPMTLKRGDIITFKEPTDTEKTIVHRIIQVNKLDSVTFNTFGDNNDAVDNWTVMSDHILGKAVFSLPFVGYAILWLKTPIGFALGMGIPALILLILQIKKIKEGIHEEVERRAKETFKRQYPHIFYALLFILAVGVTSTQAAYALFTTQAQVNGINLQVGRSASYPSPVGSTNTIIINNSSTTTVAQSNTSTVSNTITTHSSTGNNSVSNVVGSSSAIMTGNAISTEVVTNQSSTNEMLISPDPSSSISALIAQ